MKRYHPSKKKTSRLLKGRGMNVNQRELNQHIEFEPEHLIQQRAPLTKRVLSACLSELKDWLEAINFTSPTVYHFIFLCTDISLFFFARPSAKQEITLNEILPSNDSFLNLLMMHPLRVQ
ncbi:hypothetical protein NQ317_002189, partial [Molorchus minor]